MFSLPGGWELVLIIVIIIVLFKGNRAGKIIKDMGKGIYKAKKEVDEIKNITKKDIL